MLTIPLGLITHGQVLCVKYARLVGFVRKHLFYSLSQTNVYSNLQLLFAVLSILSRPYMIGPFPPNVSRRGRNGNTLTRHELGLDEYLNFVPHTPHFDQICIICYGLFVLIIIHKVQKCIQIHR